MIRFHYSVCFVFLWAGFCLQCLSGDGEVVATRLLQVTAQVEDPAMMIPVGKAFAGALPKSERGLPLRVVLAIQEGSWQDVLPKAKVGPKAFGQDYVYDLGAGESPLASLSRWMVQGLSSGTCEERLEMARALHRVFPEQEIFTYMIRGIEAALEENVQYSQLYVRGQQMVKHYTELLQVREIELAQKEHDVDYKAAREWTKKVNACKEELRKANAMIEQGKQYQPLNASLPPLAKKLFVSINELEVIGDL